MNVHAGGILRDVLREKGMTLGAFADMLGLHPTSVTKMLQQRDMKLSRLLRMEELLGVDLMGRMRPELGERLAEREREIAELEERLRQKEREMELMAVEVEVLRRITG